MWPLDKQNFVFVGENYTFAYKVGQSGRNNMVKIVAFFKTNNNQIFSLFTLVLEILKEKSSKCQFCVHLLSDFKPRC